VVGRWPEPCADREDAEAEARMEALIELIGSVRGLRQEYDVPFSQELEIHLTHVPEVLRGALQVEERAVRRLAKVREVVADGRVPVAAGGGGNGGRKPPGAHAVLRSGAELFIPLADVIDLERERGRLAAERERVEKLLEGVERKLANEQFVSRAPEAVVAREREKAEALRAQRDRLLSKLSALA
jgi:valyl-tRNA synthetase